MLEKISGTQDQSLAIAKIIQFIMILMLFGTGCVQITGIPVLFFRPEREVTQTGEIIYKSQYPDIYSIPMEFDLYGDRQIYEIQMLTLGYSGKYIAFLLLALFPISQHFTHTLFHGQFIFSGIFLCSLVLYCTPQYLSIVIFVQFTSFCYYYGQIYQYTRSQFQGLLSKDSALWVNSSWSIAMFIQVLFETFYGNWRMIMIVYTGITNLVLGILTLLLSKYINTREKKLNLNKIQQIQNKDQEINSEHNIIEGELQSNSNHQQSTVEQIKKLVNKLKQDKTSVFNICLWAFCWNAYGVSYGGCVLALNRLQGNMYFNLYVSTLFEFGGNFISIFLIKSFNAKKVITINILIIGLSYASLILFPYSDGPNKESDILAIFISLFPIIIAKVTSETMWNLLIEIQKQTLDIDYHQFNFSISNLINYFICSGLPYYNYQMSKLQINPFIGYGFYILIIAYFSTKFIIKNERTEGQQIINTVTKNQQEEELQTISKKLIEN